MTMKLRSIAKLLRRRNFSSSAPNPHKRFETANKLPGGSVAKVPETSSFPAILAMSVVGGYMSYIVSDYVISMTHHRRLMRHAKELQHLRKVRDEMQEILDKKREVLAKKIETW